MSARLFGVDDALDTDAWYTPPWIFDGLGVTFDLDVAAPADPLPWIPTRQRYSVADDGLLLPWFGLVWCNPPYSEPRPWCQRWAEHPDGLLLIRSDLSTAGPFLAFTAASSMFVASQRIQFVDGRGIDFGRYVRGDAGEVLHRRDANFSSVLLGRGPVADAAIVRLASLRGGAARQLSPGSSVEEAG